MPDDDAGPARKAIQHLISQSDMQEIQNKNETGRYSITENVKNLHNKAVIKNSPDWKGGGQMFDSLEKRAG